MKLVNEEVIVKQYAECWMGVVSKGYDLDLKGLIKDPTYENLERVHGNDVYSHMKCDSCSEEFKSAVSLDVNWQGEKGDFVICRSCIYKMADLI